MIAAWIQHFLSEDKLWYHLHLSFKRGPHVPWFTGEGMHTAVRCSPVFNYIDHLSSFQKCSSSHKLVCLFILFVITCFISVSRGIKRASQTPVHVTIRQFETDNRRSQFVRLTFLASALRHSKVESYGK